jgi:hypothetical protein
MSKEEFLYLAGNFITKETAKGVNEICGLSKTSSMIVNLLTNLPIKIELRHTQEQPKPSTKLNCLNEFVHAYVRHDDMSKMYISFFYSKDKHIKKIYKAIEKHPSFFVYLYVREALKLVRRMNTKTHYKMMSSIITQHAPDLPIELHYKLSLIACSYVVNGIVYKLLSNVLQDKVVDSILVGQHFDPNYEDYSEVEVLIDLITNKQICLNGSVVIDEDFMYNALLNLLVPTSYDHINTDESIQTDLGETLETHMQQMSRGSGSAEIFSKFFNAKKVKTGWFKKLVSKFSKEVYYRTSSFTSQWSGFNNMYRHQFKAPNTKYEENKISVILSIDHSGSMSTEALQKLLYLFEKHSKKIARLNVLIHDNEIVKEFTLESDFDISSHPKFQEALAHRFAVGGTSHYEVFKKIDDMIKSRSIDCAKTIYISFSDNCSDIVESWNHFPTLKHISTTFLSPIDNPVNVQGTVDITMM